jgi:hypothetical protein
MSYKLRADQIRTINHEKYRFSVNGQKWQTIDEMLQVKGGKMSMGVFFLIKVILGWYLQCSYW